MLKYKLGFALLVALTVATAGWVGWLLTVQSTAEAKPDPGAEPTGQAQSTEDRASRTRPPEDAPPESVPSGAERARVVGHVDGDTVELVSLHARSSWGDGSPTTVRLLEIDTPESVDPASPEQCFADRASQQLQMLMPPGSEVWVKPDREVLDPYGRTLLYAWTPGGRFINLEMVSRGAAKAVLFEPNDEFINVLRRAEAVAREKGRGLWGQCAFFGQPLVGSTHSEPAPDPGADPRFTTCADANAEGLGNYVSGVDVEYDWYDDSDSDGIVCEF